MSSLLLPYTLITASVLAIVAVILARRVGIVMFIRNVQTIPSSEAPPELLSRMQAQINFMEYVPLTLIMMGLLEAGGADRNFLIAFGAVLIVCRLLHIAGVSRKARNFQSIAGEAGSILLLLVAAGYGFYLANSAF